MSPTQRVLVTPRSLTSYPPPALDRLRAAGFEPVFAAAGRLPDEAELIRLLPGCVGWLAGVEPVSERAVAAADALKVVSRNGTGIDNLPLEALKARGIAVRKADGANAVGVAELAIGLMLAAARQIPATDRGIKAAEWPRLKGREIMGSAVGIFGLGAVGAHVARVVAAMGARILAFDPARPEIGVSPHILRHAKPSEIFAGADFITLHCPPPPGGRALIDEAALAAMRPGAILVNTARAALVDEAALIAALDAGPLAAYACDVFAEEPPVQLALAGHSKVVATSHIGALTAESVDKATEAAIDNLLAVLAPGG